MGGGRWCLCESPLSVMFRPDSDQLLKWEIDGLTDRLLAPHSKVVPAPVHKTAGYSLTASMISHSLSILSVCASVLWLLLLLPLEMSTRGLYPHG